MTDDVHSTGPTALTTSSSGQVKVRFWGVRGSIAAPLTAADVRKKKIQAVKEYQNFLKTFKQHPLPDPEKFFDVPGATPDTYGGNTSCVEVRHNEKIIILDMGTGLRPFGNSVYAEMIKQGGLDTIFLVSHVHWDHIQGFPFYGEIYVNKNLNPKIFNKWKFVGGTGWQKTAEECLRKQMEAPNFPFSFDEIEKITGKLAFDDMVDGKELQIDDTTCRVRRLDHPQETYGSRLEFPGGRVVVYTTDNEPRDPLFPAEPLLWLAKGANIWITDCQYTKNQYEGKDPGGVRHGWGHSYPEAVAKTAVIAGVETVVLFHHDPASSDEKIAQMVVHTQNLINKMGGTSKVIGAWEGLELTV